MRQAALVLALLAALALPGARADHDSGYALVTSTDFDAEHPPVAGIPAEVNYFALEAGAITGHHNAIVALSSGGVEVASVPFTHEHDSIFNALVTPARAGVLHLDIALPPLDLGTHEGGHDIPEGDLLAHGMVHAEAVPLVPAAVATLSVEGAAMAAAPSTFTFRLADADGAPLTGYVFATFLAEPPGLGEVVWRQAKLAASDGEASLTFPAPPEGLTVRAFAWPSIFTGPMWAPVVLEPTFFAAAPAPGAPEVRPNPPPLPDPAAMAAPGHEHGGGAHLYLSTDPAPRNWVMQTTRVNLIAMDEGMRPLRHVDVAMRVTGATGQVWFATEAMHEVDGMAQADLFFPLPGQYLVEATATPLGGEPMMAERWFEVGAQGTNARPAEVLLDAPEALEVGAPAPMTLGLRYLGTGDSVPHTDYWVRVLREGVDVFQTKIHTHQGDAALAFAPALAGGHEVRLAAYPQAGGFLGSRSAEVRSLAATGALADAPPLVPTSGDAPPRAAPGLETAAMVAALGALALLRRRA